MTAPVAAAPAWSTACPDWRDRIKTGRSIIPPPIFPDEAEAGLAVMRELKIVDAPGSPTMGEACAPWVLELAASIFGAYDAQTGHRLITEWFVCVPKKNSKALALDTEIPTPSGWTTMGELAVGNKVFGIDGLPCAVTATSEVWTDHKCYRLTFSNGESVLADAGHLWLTSALVDAPGAGVGGGLRTYRKVRVRTTQEIADTLLRLNDGARNHSLVLPEPIDGPDIDLPVAPYTLGAWLGDGHSDSARITCHDDDVAIRESIVADGWPVRWTSNNGSAASTYGINSGVRGQTKAQRSVGLVASLRRCDVLNNKHIPDAYFRASRAQRLALLQGLMDTDGSIALSGRVLTYTGINERLVRGVSELLSTFGIKNTLIRRPVACNGKPCGDAFFVQFMAFRDRLPVFRLPRKLARMRKSVAGNLARSRTVQIVAAERIDPVPVKCITVDSPDHQFLFGRTMLPTHNSTVAAGIMLTALIRNWRESAEFIILAPTVEVANNSFGPANDMCRKDEELEELMHVQAHVKTITHRTSKANLKVVAADSNTVGGKKAVGILIDEAWLFGKVANAENMLREATGGLASRDEGFIIWLTTQSDDPPAGVFKQKLDYARNVRDGKIIDPRFVPVIYEFPEDMIASKAYADPANWDIVIPNMGRSVNKDFLTWQYGKDQAAGEQSMRGFWAKYLNVEIGMALRSDRWAGAEFWEAQHDKTLTLETFLARCEVVVAGIDGGGLDDLLGLCLMGRERGSGKWLHWAHAWAHQIVLERRKDIAPALLDFQKEGDLTIVAQPGDDVDAIADLLCRVRDMQLLPEKQCIGVDAAGIGDIVTELTSAERKFDITEIVAIKQGWTLNGAIKTTERALAGHELLHCGSRLMNWCVGNARIVQAGNAVTINKQVSGSAKIDPLMATFDAVSLMLHNPKARQKKYQAFFVGR